MKKFIIRFSDSHGWKYMLCADVKEEEIEAIKKKIIKSLVVKNTYACSRNGIKYPAEDPKILEQLKNITGYDFVGLIPDLNLSFGGEEFDLPGQV